MQKTFKKSIMTKINIHIQVLQVRKDTDTVCRESTYRHIHNTVMKQPTNFI